MEMGWKRHFLALKKQMFLRDRELIDHGSSPLQKKSVLEICLLHDLNTVYLIPMACFSYES